MCLPTKSIIRAIAVSILFLFLVTLATAQGIKEKKTDTYATSGQITLLWRKTLSESDHTNATMSFEYATRNGLKLTGNDWDVALQGEGSKQQPYMLDVRMVTDDKSDIWDLGKTPLRKVTKKSAKKKGAKRSPYDGTFSGTGIPPVAGHSYLVHTVDRDSDYWAKFTVDKVSPRKSIKISWELLTTPQRQLDKDRKKLAKDRKRREKKKK